MASTRKTRKVNKRFAKVNEDWPDKDGPSGSSSKNRNRKKKLVDMLGPQWSKEELERFYDSYRKYGKDWRKVGGAVRNRTSDMAEALYNMNRAYLSLPEGAATAAGLIAMMTDHYSHLDGSNSENESPESAKATTTTTSVKHKGSKGKGKALKPSKPPRYPDLLQYEPASSSFSALSALKKRQRSQPRAVGKRTPRVAVGRMYNRDYNKVSASGMGKDDEEEEQGAHVAAMALAHVFHHPSPIKSGGEGSLGSREAENEQSPAKRAGGGGKQKRRSQRRKQKGPSTSKPNKSHHHDDDEEEEEEEEDDKGACSGTDEGGRNTNSSGKRRDATHNDNEDDDDFGSGRKRNRQLFFGDEDESSALDALHTLADLSVNILQPTPPIAESESSSGHEKEEDEKQQQGRRRTPAKRDKRKKPEAGGDGGPSKRSKKGDSIASASEATATEPDINNNTPSKPDKAKRRKATPTKRSKDEAAKAVLQKGDEEKARVGGSQAQASTTPSKAIKYVLSSSSPSSIVHPSKPPLTTTTAAAAAIMSKRKRMDRRKSGIVKAYSQTPPADIKDKSNMRLLAAGDGMKEKVSHALSSSLFRRWCRCEWFYSAIDYPWFMQSEYVEYLHHVKLGHIPRLTRVEWGVIRNSLGKPRRLSRHFLKAETAKLNNYRDFVRTHYYHLKKEPRVLSVGQRVVARHPKSQELHDSTILVVYRDAYRVQFDRPHLTVHKVNDFDCMPIYSPSNNNPNPNLIPIPNPNPFKFAMRPQQPPPPTAATSSHPINALSNQAKVDNIDSVALAKACVDEAAAAAQESMYNQPCTLSQIQEREADIRALDELKRALEKKEALLMELRNMNDDVSGGKNMNEPDDDDDSVSSDNDHFRKQYAMVLLQLRDANDQVASALLALRQRNTYMGNPQNAWARSMEAPSGGEMMLLNNSHHHQHQEDYEGTPHQVVEIMDKSRRKAKAMVDTAVQAMCAAGEGEDALVKIGEALDALGSNHNHNRIHNNNNHAAANNAASSGSSILGIRRIPPSDSASCGNNVSLPCDLISSCVSTLLMIQSCTERQHPPAEVAHILDSALLSMQPCCPENQPIFREIETCIGIIKNQMLALIPTPTI